MTERNEDDDLTPVVGSLNERVAALTDAVAVRDDQIDKLATTTRWAIGGAVAACIVGVVAVIGLLQANDAADKARTAAKDTQHAQVVNCQNANSTRGGQRLLWDFILDLSGADAGPAEATALSEIRTWIHDLFAARDCSDLDKKVETPAPPSVQEIFDQLKQAGEAK